MLVGFIKEIPDVEFVMEIISERFDDAVNFMTEGSVVYGGAVRDALAGVPIEGDLDLAVSKHEFISISRAFEAGSKWVEATDGKSVKDYSKKSSGKLSLTRGIILPTPHDSNSRLYTMKTFRNLHGMEAQILVPSTHSSNPLDEAMSLVRDVDIVCCGVLMTSDGRVFEVVPSAYDDCVKRVLRYNTSADPLYIKALPKRVEKLVARGWTSEIDVRSVMAKWARARRKKETQPPKEPTALDAPYYGGVISATDQSKYTDGLISTATVSARLYSVQDEFDIPPTMDSYEVAEPTPVQRPGAPSEEFTTSFMVRKEFAEKACAIVSLAAPGGSEVNVAISDEGPLANIRLRGHIRREVVLFAEEIKKVCHKLEHEEAVSSKPDVKRSTRYKPSEMYNTFAMASESALHGVLASTRPRPTPNPRPHKTRTYRKDRS